MTEQQYRVIADRGKGDNCRGWNQIEDGDRVTFGAVDYPGGTVHRSIVRIERPVPTTELPDPLHLTGAEADSFHAAMQDPEPAVPTREQIAEGLALVDAAHECMANIGEGDWTPQDHLLLRMTNELHAVLALFQNGADR